jgi:hypothetical protein
VSPLICPRCRTVVQSTRRGMHAPCLHCAAAGVVVQLRQVAEQPEQPAARAELPPDAPFAWDCQRDGHVFIGPDACFRCKAPQPANPAAVVVVVVALALGLALLLPGCGGAAGEPARVPPQIGKACTAADVNAQPDFCGSQIPGTLVIGCLEELGKPGVCVELCGGANPPCPEGYGCKSDGLFFICQEENP